MSYARDASVNRAIRERERQLVMDYPTLVTRITLYMGAGMSLSGIFSYMAESARKQGEDRTNYLNREICRTENEIQSGIPEDQAVEMYSLKKREEYSLISFRLSPMMRYSDCSEKSHHWQSEQIRF